MPIQLWSHKNWFVSSKLNLPKNWCLIKMDGWNKLDGLYFQPANKCQNSTENPWFTSGGRLWYFHVIPVTIPGLVVVELTTPQECGFISILLRTCAHYTTRTRWTSIHEANKNEKWITNETTFNNLEREVILHAAKTAESIRQLFHLAC